jgi:hypothetical protein
MAALAPKKPWLQVLPFFAFFIVLFIFTCRLPFFWDKDILFSKIATWLLAHHFSPVLPNELDAGYPPALGYLLALTWKITGKSLFFAHLLMLPFTLGIVWQTRNLLDHLLGGRYIMPVMLLLFADTTLLAQTVVFSTDLVMLFFTLLAVNGMLHNRRNLLMLAITGMLFSHLRGLMIAAALGCLDIYLCHGRKDFRTLFHVAWSYFPGLALFTAWLLFHYYTTGWVFMHPASPWSGCYEVVSGKGLVRNVLILGWRMIDYGKLFVWIIPLLAIFRSDRKRLFSDPVIRTLLMLLAFILVFSAPTMLIYKILNGHRYLIPFYFFLILLAGYLLFINPGFPLFRKALFTLVLAGLISGSFWVYPGRIANGWDATLAHLPYHHLRKKMIHYLEEQQIPFERTGTGVPNTAAIGYIEANGDPRIFPLADLQRHSYIFYSNVFNMFTDAEIDTLEHWPLEKEFRCMQVYVRLYRNPSSDIPPYNAEK